MDLGEAIERFVRPGSTLHFGMAGSRPNAAIRELHRRFRAQPGAGFTLCSTGFGGPQLGLFLVRAGIAKTVVAGFAGDQYPSPRPNRALRRQLEHGLKLEDWSLHTYLLRLRAGAMGVPFMPTASLSGTDLAADRARSVEVDGQALTLVPALRPDVAFLHGIIADPDGNVVLSMPLGEGALGAAAARNGAIVTVERIVSREEFRGFAGLPALPSKFVAAVCEAPFGAHPSGMFADRVDPELSYGDDYDFISETVRILADPDDVPEDWLEHWLDAPAAEYPERIGAERRAALRNWKQWRLPALKEAPAQPSRAERLCVYASRLIRDFVAEEEPDSVLAGIGISSLATWLAAAAAPAFPPLISEVGFVDYEPQAGNPFLFYFPNVAKTSILTDSDLVLGPMLSGGGERALAVLASGEIDGSGATNASWTASGWLTGSGGANDIAAGARDVIVVVPHTSTRLVAEVAFATSAGRNVKAVVTDRGVLRRSASADPFTLVAVGVDNGSSIEEAIEGFRASVPWKLDVGTVVPLAEAEEDEIARLRAYDPERFFLGSAAPASEKR